MGFSTLQEYGVDKVFLLENNNIDASQKNVIFLTRGKNVARPLAVAGMYMRFNVIILMLDIILWLGHARTSPIYFVSLPHFMCIVR